MSTSESIVSKNSYSNELFHANTDEQMHCSSNRKRSVQHPSEYETIIHTPKRNRLEMTGSNTGFDYHSTQSNRNQQEIIKTTVSTTNPSYFNTYHQPKKISNDSSARFRGESSRQSFPSFRIILQDVDKYPTTELSVIKELNKYFKLNLTYGRYAKAANNQICFLLYTNTTAQFEHLMCESNWPDRICNSEYTLDLPKKIPVSYSIVVLNVPSQWNVEAFGNELKQHYPSIVRVVRLFIKGGRPLSKVRVDFSSYKELSPILKSKRILLDDNNTAYAVEQYVPPTQVLRCYNCQAYDDHIAAHCPNKNNPICFRCAQQHPYDPKCSNPVRCAHCQGEHMAGNPNYPFKLEKRYEKSQRLKLSNGTINSSAVQRKNAWTTNTRENLFGNDIRNVTPTTGATSSSMVNDNNNYQLDITNVLNQINNTMLVVKQQQDELNKKFSLFEVNLNSYSNEMNHIKFCINDILCPLLKEISNQVYLKAKGVNKQAISPLHNKLVNFISKNSNHTNVDNLSCIKAIVQDRAISNSVFDHMASDES
ncbi:unnamed protein product [Rotaria sp. Silwood2]|nr:unnamed protein product [Rotaria sp. Silwood2]CAF4025290.1 unnamed protein product [Rotaria sp. Silwood2]